MEKRFQARKKQKRRVFVFALFVRDATCDEMKKTKRPRPMKTGGGFSLLFRTGAQPGTA